MDTSVNHSKIYVVEDNEGDALVIKNAIKKAGLINDIFFLQNGEQLLERLDDDLDRETQKGEKWLPILVLMDLNMPRLDGQEALKRIKKKESLRKIPVIILTNSTDPKNVEDAYVAGASAFITKPNSYEAMVALMQMTRAFWLEAARLA